MNNYLLPRVLLLFVLMLCGVSSDLSASNMERLIGADCSRCHGKEIARLTASGGSHATDTDCLDCHLQHPQQRGSDYQVTDCSSCHDPQQAEHFTIGSCRGCHHPHWPLEIDFTSFDQPVKKLCFSCHESPFDAGSPAHAENLRCNQCHLSHTAIASCQDCHAGHSEGEAEEPCLSCHAAHNPLPPIPLQTFTSITCSACHAETSADLAADAGAHAQMSCADCHLLHAQRPDCLQCHQGHSDTMVSSDCRFCHDHHRPLPVDFTAAPKAPLCSACHQQQVDQFVRSGAAHVQELDCVVCHLAHATTESSPLQCLSCHSPAGTPHFTRDNCQQCHDPHRPLLVDLSELENVRPLCADCHAEVVAMQERSVTAHSDSLTCNQCHEVHGESPSCLDCHQGHSEEMQAGDCSQCHNPHSPLPVKFLAATGASLCQSCHPQAVADLAAGGKAHQSELACIDCHSQHPPGDEVIPGCENCHAATEQQHFAIEACIDCHHPHQPLQKDLSTFLGSRPVCAGCHPQVEAQLAANVSAHDRDCVACHRRHIGVPSCTGCHDPHGEATAKTDCSSCHQPHAPLQINMPAQLKSQLCGDCHAAEVEVVKAAGGGHRDQLLCADCHRLHPAAACADCHAQHPQQGQGIPDSCFSCHAPSEHPHYTVGDCQQCHNPHQPLELDLSQRQPLTPVCIGCHQQVAEQFTSMPGGHSQQDCEKCHSQHSNIRICLDCHQSHAEAIGRDDCLSCHPAHQPQDIQYQQAAQLPQNFCAACHEQQAAELLAKGGAHQQEFSSCTSCHPQHLPNGELTALACGQCHTRTWRRHYTLEDCAGCHNPHQPLEVALDKQDELRPVCVSCHNNQQRLYALYPNKHSEFDCRKCHAGRHGSKMLCQDCHKSHLPKLTQVQCLKCHPPHLPQVIKERPGQVGAICAACHQQAAEKLNELGTAHKKQPCVACHPSHPPHGEQVFPRCEACHDPDDNQHYSVSSCQDCHQGHQPLGHDLIKAQAGNSACQACHLEVIELFASASDRHAEQPCNSCHQRHGESLNCVDCHQPHDETMADSACLTCHAGHHAPAPVAFSAALPAAFCQSCHPTQVDALAAGLTGHTELNCIDCHGGEHGSKLDCADCHQAPHDPGLHRKFPDCLKCHIEPHDLADWKSRKPQLEMDAVEPVSPETGTSEVVK